MKYWRGYLIAAILGALTWGMMEFAKAHTALVDMFYPYFTRLIQTTLAGWASGVNFCLWQLLVVFLVMLLIATIVLMIIFKWNFIQWLGWVLASATMLFTLHTGLYGLNSYSGPLAEDIRLNVVSYDITELVEATTYFRDKANELALQIPRNELGQPQYPSFEEMAQSAGEGFETLTYEKSYAVFAGSTLPVKKLDWSEWYTSMSITGVTMPLTGEAAVNADIPVISLPFTMCHEMAHRMCISYERDANLAAFLACNAHSDITFQYSAYFMAYRYCYNALVGSGTSAAIAAAKQINEGVNYMLLADLTEYRTFFTSNSKEQATNVATSVNDTYIKVSGDEQGVASYGEVCDLLVSWYLQEIYWPNHQEVVEEFNPLDKNEVFGD